MYESKILNINVLRIMSKSFFRDLSQYIFLQTQKK